MTRPEALFLCHRIPYPPNKGDKIRSWRLFQHLAERYRLHLACFVDDPADMQHASFMEARCESAAFVRLSPIWARLGSLSGFLQGAPLSTAYFRHPQMHRAAAKARARPLAAEIAFSSSMAQYLSASPQDGRQRIIDFCDADAAKWSDYAAHAAFPLQQVFAREARLLADLETQIANRVDASFAVSAAEAAVFNDRAGVMRPVDWWGNGVDTVYFDPDRDYARPDAAADIVFVGAMDYRANIEAMLEFCRETWPLVRARHADATLAIVGANPAAKVTSLGGRNGVTVTGRVDDVRPWIAHAKGVIAPMRIGRGVQNKVLEAMAMAKPVITTPVAATGVQHGDGSLALCESAGEMAAAIAALLAGESGAEGRAARGDVVANHSWQAHIEKFSARLSALGV